MPVYANGDNVGPVVIVEKGGNYNIDAIYNEDGTQTLNITDATGVTPSTQAQGIFTGWTMPLTYLNSTDNVFTYESSTHNILLTGLDGVGTITGNGTKQVTLTMNVTGTSNAQTPFTITCVNDTETLTYNGIAFYYGTELGDGNCLAVAQTLTGTPLDIGYIFIESASLPYFYSTTTLWNNVYGYQIMTFSFGKWNGTTIGSYFLYYCYSYNQPITIPSSVTSIDNYFLQYSYSFNQPIIIPNSIVHIGSYFLGYCYSYNQPITIPSSVTSIGASFLYACNSLIKIEYNASVYPTDNNSLSQSTNNKTSTNGTGILITGTNASELKASLPDRTSNPYRKLVLQEVSNG